MTEHHTATVNFEHELANAQLATPLLAGRASEYCLHPGNELFGRKRLGDVIISADFQALHHIIFMGLGSQHDHGQRLSCLFLFQAPKELDTAAAGQHPVQQYHVGRFVGDQPIRFVNVGRLKTFKIGNFQGQPEHLADTGLVIDYQHFFR